MLITQWYKDSPLSEFGFCEWNPSLSILLGLLISKCCRGQSPRCGAQRLKHICKWASFSNLNKPRCAEPEVKHISMDWLGHYLVVACSIASGLVTEQGSRDIETKSLCFSPHQATLGMFVTHVRSNSHRVPRRRNCLAGGPSESAGDLPNLCEPWLNTGWLDVFSHIWHSSYYMWFLWQTTTTAAAPMNEYNYVRIIILDWFWVFNFVRGKKSDNLNNSLVSLFWETAEEQKMLQVLMFCRTLELPVLIPFDLKLYLCIILHWSPWTICLCVLLQLDLISLPYQLCPYTLMHVLQLAPNGDDVISNCTN